MKALERGRPYRWATWASLAGIAISVMALGCGGNESEDGAPANPPARQGVMPERPESFEPKPIPPRKTEAEKARETIAGYDERIQGAPDEADTPVLIMAAGNLYRQKLQDYARAAGYYERYINEYPEGDQRSLAYMQLATCYERLNRGEDLNILYNRMLDDFPEGSPENEFAQDRLGLVQRD